MHVSEVLDTTKPESKTACGGHEGRKCPRLPFPACASILLANVGLKSQACGNITDRPTVTMATSQTKPNDEKKKMEKLTGDVLKAFTGTFGHY